MPRTASTSCSATRRRSLPATRRAASTRTSTELASSERSPHLLPPPSGGGQGGGCLEDYRLVAEILPAGFERSLGDPVLGRMQRVVDPYGIRAHAGERDRVFVQRIWIHKSVTGRPGSGRRTT